MQATSKLFWIALVIAISFAPVGKVQANPPGLGHSAIFGGDDRLPVTDTHHWPWSAIALIRVFWSSDDVIGNYCTGWMIGPSTLATAAHCIYHDGYPIKVIIKPAMNSDDPISLPFGSCSFIDAVAPDGWIDGRGIEYDYGVYHLDCKVGKLTGTLGFKSSSGDWTGRALQLTGYPNDLPGRTMWSGLGEVTSSSAKGLRYNIDMWRGQSGAPVWDLEDTTCPYCVVAINSSEATAPAMNFGARIDQEAFEFFQKELR